MRTLKELRDSIDPDVYDLQLGRVVQELIDNLLLEGLVLYYPVGFSTANNGETKNNSEVAREILLAVRSGKLVDVALPTGWELKRRGEIVDVQEVPND